MSANNEQRLISKQELSSLRERFNNAVYVADDIVTKNYLARLTEMDVIEPDERMFVKNKKDAVRLIRIDEMVYGRDEYATHKFASVFGAMTTVENSVFLLIDSDGDKTKFYMGVRCDDPHREANTQLTTLRNTLRGQFPGIKATGNTEYKNPDIVELINGIPSGGISSVSCVANLRDEETRDNKAFLQGLEKFAISLRGKPYTAFILANSLPQDRIAEIRRMYERIYTQLSPFAELQSAYGDNESWNTSVSESAGTSVGTTDTAGHTTTAGTSASESVGTSSSESRDNTASRVLKGLAAAVSIVGGTVAAVALTTATAGIAAPLAAGIFAGVAGGTLSAAGDAAKKTVTTGENTNRTTSTNESESDSTSRAKSESRTDTRTETYGQSGGTSYTSTLTVKNKTVISLMERIDKQLERMRAFESYGMWECGAFFVSPEHNVSEIAAATYKAIMSGEHTGVEISTVNSWGRNSPHNEKIHKYITNFMQPLFRYRGGQGSLDVTAGSFVSGKELALHMGLPRRSVPGFPVIEHAEFAKEAIRYEAGGDEKTFAIGKVYAMGRADDHLDARLDVNSLTMHTFVTGSTGSGKSNTIYEMLHRLKTAYGIPFLVVEPAKGEYKKIFGQCPGVSVYGTNPQKSDLLRINPFRFPSDIHVLEHLDRLVELFNVCWPMYAAMPAILKEAMERAYTEAGWSLENSKNPSGDRFPNFAELSAQVENVVNESKYSSDSKGDYSGALCTRVRSLTNGLNRLIFNNDDLSDADLFDKNTIVDLSRVGSTETKSLIMGLLVMKLNEYRMTSGKTNSPLTHITVLEEAHNLLKHTSTEQSSESSNLLGKSVEMLANSIAEMRTYGEGFIIADQSPGLLDMSVIRNTNTKIILRLPERSDRELVGKSASLNDEQITELSKLEKGVAAVYQNDWVEPVLVKINKCEIEEKDFKYSQGDGDHDKTAIMRRIIHLLIQGRVEERLDFDTTEIRRSLASLPLTVRQQSFIERYVDEYESSGCVSIWREDKFETLARYIGQSSGLTSKIEDLVAEAADADELTAGIALAINRRLPGFSDAVVLALTHCLMKDFSIKREEAETREKIYKKWVESADGGRSVK